MLLFCGIAWTYHRQLLDPAATRAPSAQFRAAPSANNNNNNGSHPGDMDGTAYDTTAFPEHYAPPYLGYDAPAPSYAPPAGPPPAFGKPPVYDPVDGARKGYLGDDDAHKGYQGLEDGKDDDPFADFDGPARKPAESREALV